MAPSHPHAGPLQIAAVLAVAIPIGYLVVCLAIAEHHAGRDRVRRAQARDRDRILQGIAQAKLLEDAELMPGTVVNLAGGVTYVRLPYQRDRWT